AAHSRAATRPRLDCERNDATTPGRWNAARSGVASSERHPLDRADRLGVGEARHPEPVQRPDHAGEQGNDQRHLERERSGIRVDADDLRLYILVLSCTTAEIETFISDVSTTRTNVAIARRIANPVPPAGSSAGAAGVASCA